MTNTQVRWIQRFQNYKKALLQLKKFIDKGTLNELEEQGFVQAFEYTYELCWNTLRDYFIHQGTESINGSRDAFREGFRLGILLNGELWMEMLRDRNRSSHTYNEQIAKEITANIKNIYFTLFKEMRKTMEQFEASSENE